MKIKYLFALLLPSLAALLAVLPYAKAVTTAKHLPAPPSAPYAASELGSGLISVAAAEKFVQRPPNFSLEMGSITGSCWMSQDDMISWNGHELTVFNRKTQQATPMPGAETVVSGKHWVSIAALSPDSRWLVWAGGEDGHSTWEAITTDGAEHKQWPRDEAISTPAIAWMQDNKHWVELCNPETQVNAREWRSQPNNLRARVYSLDMPNIQEFPLHLETPNQAFILPPNCGKTAEFIFTKDGHAWLSQNWQTAPTAQGDGRCSREDIYELLPGSSSWTLHKSFVYPVADQERWMFDSAARSPDGQWIAWRNYAPTGKDKLRLMLSRTNGSEMQMIYQSDTSSGVQPEWSPDSRQIAFTDNGPLGIVTLKISEVTAAARPCSPSQIASGVKTTGKFPVAHSQTLVAAGP